MNIETQIMKRNLRYSSHFTGRIFGVFLCCLLSSFLHSQITVIGNKGVPVSKETVISKRDSIFTSNKTKIYIAPDAVVSNLDAMFTRDYELTEDSIQDSSGKPADKKTIVHKTPVAEKKKQTEKKPEAPQKQFPQNNLESFTAPKSDSAFTLGSWFKVQVVLSQIFQLKDSIDTAQQYSVLKTLDNNKTKWSQFCLFDFSKGYYALFSGRAPPVSLS